MPKLRKTTIKPLAAEEWDFERLIGQRKLDAKQVDFCRTYEIAREIPKIKDAFNRDIEYQERDDISVSWRAIVSLGICNPPESFDPFVEVLDVPDGFPSKPYLSIFKGHKPSTKGFTPFSNLPSVRTVMSSQPDVDAYQLYIEWYRSDKNLIGAFKEWLKLNRPYPPVEHRGLNQQTVSIADLKALGAHRLIRHCKTADAALNYTIQCGHLHGLYASLSDWSKANARARKMIASWKEANIQVM